MKRLLVPKVPPEKVQRMRHLLSPQSSAALVIPVPQKEIEEWRGRMAQDPGPSRRLPRQEQKTVGKCPHHKCGGQIIAEITRTRRPDPLGRIPGNDLGDEVSQVLHCDTCEGMFYRIPRPKKPTQRSH